MIWKRYFLREFAAIFFLFIFSIYFLYVLIDYSAHTKTFHQPGINTLDIISYYAFRFPTVAADFIALALMIATIKVLTTLNSRREIVALAASGLSFKRLLSPFVGVALLAMLALYANLQWIEPKSLAKIEAFESCYFKEKMTAEAHAKRLKDGSLLLYHHFDVEEQKLHDLFWLKDLDHIYHMATLHPESSLATDVNLIKQNKGLHVVETIDELQFPLMEFDSKSFLPKSLTEMAHASWDANLIYKLTLPVSALLAVLCPAPFCLRFSKQTPTFMIYTVALVAYVAYFAISHALLIAFKA